MNQRILRLVKIIKIINIMFMMVKVFLLVRKRLRRRWWVRPVNITRNSLGFQKICFGDLMLNDGEHFFKATRMTIEDFNTLLDLLKNRLQRFSKRKPIDEETRLGLTLIYLAHGCSPHFLAWTYKMGVSTVRKIIYETCDAIWSELHEVHVAQPNRHRWKAIADRFNTQQRLIWIKA